jgi:hypothetical protein
MSDRQRRRHYGHKKTIYTRGPPKTNDINSYAPKKINDENFYFYSGSAIDWILAKRKLEGAFREADVWDLVEIPDGMEPIITLDANGIAGPALMPEVTIPIPEPDYTVMVTHAAAHYITTINNNHNYNQTLINASPSLTDVQKEAKILNLQIKRNDEMLKITPYNNQLEINITHVKNNTIK